MHPTLLSEEITDTPPARLSASRIWVMQTVLLFGMLLLGRWSRPVLAQLQSGQLPLSGTQPTTPSLVRWLQPPKTPHQTAETGAVVSRMAP